MSISEDKTDLVNLETKRKRKRKHKGSTKESNDSKDDDGEQGDIDRKLPKTKGDDVSDRPATGLAAAFNNNRTVYIEGLPFTAKESDVIEFFKPAGRVLSVRLPTWQDSGRLRGYGHVEFTNAEMATKALEMDGCDMQNRYIKVARPMTPRLFQAIEETPKIEKPIGCRSVFVKNIPYEVTEEDVKEAMKVCGPIESIRLAVWGHTKKLKGFGYIDFVREESSEIAVKKSGHLQIKGRPVLIDFETGQAKASFKKVEGKRKN